MLYFVIIYVFSNLQLYSSKQILFGSWEERLFCLHETCITHRRFIAEQYLNSPRAYLPYLNIYFHGSNPYEYIFTTNPACTIFSTKTTIPSPLPSFWPSWAGQSDLESSWADML